MVSHDDTIDDISTIDFEQFNFGDAELELTSLASMVKQETISDPTMRMEVDVKETVNLDEMLVKSSHRIADTVTQSRNPTQSVRVGSVLLACHQKSIVNSRLGTRFRFDALPIPFPVS
jgi:hypothetical protein